MGLITKTGRYKTIYEINPAATYFLATYQDRVIKGGGLDNTGWDRLEDGIVSLKYILSTGVIIELPKYQKYLHLVEASMSIDNNTDQLYGKNYHYVYIKGYTGSEVLTHCICLRSSEKHGVGKVDVFLDDVDEVDKYGDSWKESI